MVGKNISPEMEQQIRLIVQQEISDHEKSEASDSQARFNQLEAQLSQLSAEITLLTGGVEKLKKSGTHEIEIGELSDETAKQFKLGPYSK